jgi:DNA-binding MarR family transcriptional regulator
MPADTYVPPTALTEAQRPQGCTNFKLRQLTRRVTQHYDQHLALVDLKITQYSLLSHVVVLGPMSPGELARRMDMDASTLSRNLKPLVTAGWLVVGDGVDGRSRQVAITPSGRVLRKRAQRHWKAAQLALNERFGPDTVVALHRLLDEGLAAFHSADQDEAN